MRAAQADLWFRVCALVRVAQDRRATAPLASVEQSKMSVAELGSGTKEERMRGMAAVVSSRGYNTAGRMVKTLTEGPAKPGNYASVWDGTDSRGKRVGAGVYLYALDAGDQRYG
jgi:flagellar hook assembly protein FlgD